MTNLWLVCYDVRDDKRRNKLAKLMEQRCERVQYSVFECPLDSKVLDQQLQRWLKVLNLKEDNLRIYPLDSEAKEQTRFYGVSEPPYGVVDFIIV